MNTIEYWKPVGTAWDRMKTILFRPFNIEKWFIMGFAAWIAGLANSGGGGTGGGTSSFQNPANEDMFQDFSFSEFWAQYGDLIITVAAIVVAVILTIGIAFMWLHARGKFIFLDNVLHNREAIVDPWKKYKKQGNSLFLWNLGVGAIGALVFLAGIAICFPDTKALFQSNTLTESAIVRFIWTVLLIFLYSATVSFVQMLVNDFVMPIMLKYDLRILDAWRRFNPIFKPNFSKFILYSLVRFLVSLLTGFGILLLGLCTCCILFLAAAVPYIGTVIMLPIFVFYRLISIEFLRQFGEDADEVLPPPAPQPQLDKSTSMC